MGRGTRELAPATTPAQRAPWLAPVRRWIGEEFTGEEAAAFAAETAERDIRRLRVFGPLLVVLHVGHILLLRVSESARATLPVDVVRWHDDLVRIHAATLPLALLMSVVAFGWPESRLGRVLATFGAAGYLMHGGIVSGIDQLTLGNVAAFTGYCFGIAVIFGFPLRSAAWIYGTGGATAALAIFGFSHDPTLRMSNLLNVATVVTMSLPLNVLFFSARKRDFRQRRVIARQRDELAGLNADLARLNSDLERRVNEQVGEILKRAEEVGQLNAQLRSQIRTRSRELSLALSKLAQHRAEEGIVSAGAVLGERFEVGETIGAGGMGVVYSGLDRITGAKVAIKVIRSSSLIELDAMHRFLGEASAVAAITHPAVVRVIHVDISEEGLLYQAQEFVDGRTLENHLVEGAWPQGEAARLGAVLCDALAAAHVHGVIHRDVKPANVMLITDSPGLKLLDFGLAKLYDDVSRTAVDDGHTAVGLVVGTPAYMAPEQVLAGEVTDKADVYAAGVLLFQLLTGRLTFEIDGASRVMLQHVSVEAPDLRAIQSDIADELASLVAECLAKDAHARPIATEVSRRLRSFADAHDAPPLETLVRRAATGGDHHGPAPSSSRSIARRLKMDA
jgi:Lon protease-like protein